MQSTDAPKKMEISINAHTLQRAEERGASLEEIVATIENGIEISAKLGRLSKYKIFNYNQMRLGKFYKQKRVEVIYIIGNNVVQTVTVYVFYGHWKEIK